MNKPDGSESASLAARSEAKKAARRRDAERLAAKAKISNLSEVVGR